MGKTVYEGDGVGVPTRYGNVIASMLVGGMLYVCADINGDLSEGVSGPAELESIALPSDRLSDGVQSTIPEIELMASYDGLRQALIWAAGRFE